MVAPSWTDADTDRACEFWREYQIHHDASLLHGQTAGIDQASGRIWFGESAAEVVKQLESERLSMPLYFVRVGFDHYLRKGSHLLRHHVLYLTRPRMRHPQ